MLRGFTFFFLSVPLLAEVGTASLSGTVTDASGAAVPSARITLDGHQHGGRVWAPRPAPRSPHGHQPLLRPGLDPQRGSHRRGRYLSIQL